MFGGNRGLYVKIYQDRLLLLNEVKFFFAISFNTRSFPFINDLYNLFVIAGEKVVPINAAIL